MMHLESTRRLCFVFLFTLTACAKLGLRRSAPDEPPSLRQAAPVALEPVRVAAPANGSSPHRILLDDRALERLRTAAREQTPAFVRARARADEALNKSLESGYQGFEWADAVASSALLWHATGDERYAGAAVGYLKALLSDRLVLGDGKGGSDVVRHDSGYGVRTFGVYTALGYDWLRNAPGVDSALRERVRTRLREWLDWYAKEGYLRDRPTSNYYWGYLTALCFSGLALAGETPAADAWLQTARDELSRRVLPVFRDQLRGGGWPEGFQYGEYTGVEIALVARALRSAGGVDVPGKLPWLGQTVTHHVHALLPDQRSVYDGGTWGEHPAKPSGLAVAAFGIALEGVDDDRAAEARWLASRALPPLTREQAWLGLLAERPGAALRSPRDGAPTSLHLPGQGLTFARSDWSESAVWASFQAGPPLAEDHQDADQGHFELARGGDLLLVDGGGSEGSATINHNTLLIDDGSDNLNYPPNQGVWGDKVQTTHFADDGVVAVAVGEIGEAYAPKCARSGCRKRSVERATRSFVFVRPSLLVIDDRVRLSSPDYSVIWAAHVTEPPKVEGLQASAVVGSSRLDLASVEPKGARLVARREPTPSGEGSHRLNQPWGPMWRLELESPRGGRDRGFLNVMSAGAATASPATATALQGDGMRGVLSRADGRNIAILFTDQAEASAGLAGGAEQLVVVGLTPGKGYRRSVDAATCTVRLRQTDEASAPRATRGGFLRAGARCGAP
jgi:hypothetical protein